MTTQTTNLTSAADHYENRSRKLAVIAERMRSGEISPERAAATFLDEAARDLRYAADEMRSIAEQTQRAG